MGSDAMAPEKAIAALNDLPRGDTESCGANADLILCELLTALGHADVVKAFDDVPRWYA